MKKRMSWSTVRSGGRIAGKHICVGLLLCSCGTEQGNDGVEQVTTTDAEFEIAFQIPAVGESEPSFHVITGVALVPGGSEVVVSDDYNRSVRIFEGNGALVRELGRAGEGPGEFGDVPRRLTVVGDEVRVQDRSTHRILRFGLDGTVRGDVSSRDEISGWGRQSLLHTPEYIIQGGQILVGWGTGGSRTNLLLSEDEQVAEVLHIFPSGSMWWFRPESDRGTPVFGMESAGPGGAWAVSGDSLYVFADGYKGIIGWYRLGAGGVEKFCERDLGWEPEPFLVQRGDVVREVTEEREQRGLATDIGDMVIPEFVSRLASTLTIAQNGDAWLRLRAGNEEDRRQEMLVVPCDEAREVRQLRLPPGFILHDVREDLLAGVHIDEVTEVRTVRGYEVSW